MKQLEGVLDLIEDRGWWSYETAHPIIDVGVIVTWMAAKDLTQRMTLALMPSEQEGKVEVVLAMDVDYLPVNATPGTVINRFPEISHTCTDCDRFEEGGRCLPLGERDGRAPICERFEMTVAVTEVRLDGEDQ
jgi:hypothetical protein